MIRNATSCKSFSEGPDADRRWEAIVARDRAREDSFVYGVITTGIYCRCSCAAKTPKRGNVTFFDRAAQAETAGFRACKRCKPDGLSPAAQDRDLVAKACRIIEAGDGSPDLTSLAKHAGLSPSRFHRVFKAATGVTPKNYWLAHCGGRVRQTLRTAPTVTQAVLDAGFNSTRQFYAVSNKVLGMTPKAFRQRGHAAAIRYTIGACSLGRILVAATEKGVCAVLIGDEDETLLEDLRNRFREADLKPGGRDFERLASQVIAWAEAPGATFDLPLDIQGTAFQHRVWAALCAIPPGKTASYTEIAKDIGSPAAVRAVAGACAANPVAIIIPCHRVVRSDGGLSGYRWGPSRKRMLLDREAGQRAGVRPAPRKKGGGGA